MRIFAAERISGIMKKLGMKKGEVIEHPWVTKSIENAQKKVEAHNFDIRKHLLEYDNVANEQRMIIYAQRKDIMKLEDVSHIIEGMCIDNITATCDTFAPTGTLPELWNLEELQKQLQHKFDMEINLETWLQQNETADGEVLRQQVEQAFLEQQKQRREHMPPELLRGLEKHILLDVIDRHWRTHLQAVEYLRGSINLRAYAAKNPRQEFKREALELFSTMLDKISSDVSSIMSHLRISQQDEQKELPGERKADFSHTKSIHREGPDLLHPPSQDNRNQAPQNTQQQAPAAAPGPQMPYTRTGDKIGRNKPCPCGSGKKYKHCHGKKGPSS